MDASHTRRFLINGVLAPGITLLICVWLYRNVAPGVDLEAMTRGRFGPASWPRFMLLATMLCCTLQFLRLLVRWLRARQPGQRLYAAGVPVGSAEERYIAAAAPLAMPAEEEDPKIALAAIGVILGYGVAFELVGFFLSTVIFFVAWLLLGGLGKRPLALVLVTILGTLFNIYLFVKVAAMPLERGKGVFDDLTVAIYRLLRIY